MIYLCMIYKDMCLWFDIQMIMEVSLCVRDRAEQSFLELPWMAVPSNFLDLLPCRSLLISSGTALRPRCTWRASSCWWMPTSNRKCTLRCEP